MENQWVFRTAYNFVGISNSAEIFDPSSADVTTHIMEGFAEVGETLEHPTMQRALKYLLNTQTHFGAW